MHKGVYISSDFSVHAYELIRFHIDLSVQFDVYVKVVIMI